jgi:hypothetical protein
MYDISLPMQNPGEGRFPAQLQLLASEPVAKSVAPPTALSLKIDAPAITIDASARIVTQDR